MEVSRTINVAREFSRYPAGRFKTDGPHSGERFREEFLLPALLETSGRVALELDGTLGYGSSFLEEAFGGLVRSRRYSATELLSRLEFLTTDRSVIVDIRKAILQKK